MEKNQVRLSYPVVFWLSNFVVQAEYMRTERDVLTRVDHPYIVTLHHSFQTGSKLYLCMDFVNGGHLFFQLYRAGIFDEALARVYTAEIVLALAHLHALGIVHRGTSDADAVGAASSSHAFVT